MSDIRKNADRNRAIQAMMTDGEQLKTFYRFVANNPHIPLHDACQIVIERPNASVCFSFEKWNAQGRRVTKGRKGIPYYDSDGNKYFVFDVTDTHGENRYRRITQPVKKILDGLDLLNGTEIAESNRGDYRIMLSGAGQYKMDIGESASGNLTRLENFIKEFAAREERAVKRLESTKADFEVAKEQVKVPFEHKDKIMELNTELSELNAELDLNKREEVVIDDEESGEEPATAETEDNYVALRAAVPDEMKKRPNWVVVKTWWNAKKGRYAKRPIDCNTGEYAESDNPKTWTTFDNALKYLKEKGGTAVAYALDGKDNISCIDLDRCYDENGQQTALAKEVLSKCGKTYVEKSVSGNGLHIFGKTGGMDIRTFSKDGDLEFYQKDHFIAMTGDGTGYSSLESFDTPEMKELLSRKCEKREEWKGVCKGVNGLSTMTDRDVVEKASNAKNGDKFKRLYAGEDLQNNHSNSDMSLMNLLAYWCNGDKEQMLRIFATSGLFRPNKSPDYYEGTDMFRYKMVWEKESPTGFLNANYKPLSLFEDIVVFSKGTVGSKSKLPIRYYPQGLIQKEQVKRNRPNSTWRSGKGYGGNNKLNSDTEYVTHYANYPTDILEFSRDRNAVHPTQKPVALLEYLIKTYTKEGEAVMDNCMGSGSAGIACENTGRQFIGIEADDYYFQTAKERIEKGYGV